MSDAIECPRCGNQAFPITPLSSNQEYLCSFCGNHFDVRVHIFPDPLPPPASVFRVLVDVKGMSAIKLRLKLGMALQGVYRFSIHDLEKQAFAGKDAWEVGTFNEKELPEVERRIAAAGLTARIVPV